MVCVLIILCHLAIIFYRWVTTLFLFSIFETQTTRNSITSLSNVTFRSSRFGRLKQRLRKCGITCEEFSSCEEGLPRSAVRQLSKELTRRPKWCPAATAPTAALPPGRWRQPSGTTSEGLPTCLTSPRTTRFVQLLKNDDAEFIKRYICFFLQDVCAQLWATLYDYPCLKKCKGLHVYIESCVRASWGLVNQVHFVHFTRRNNTTNNRVYSHYISYSVETIR